MMFLNDSHDDLGLRARPPPTEVKISKIGKRGFRAQKTSISHQPRKGRFESNLYLVAKWGFFDPGAVVWSVGKWEFFDPETTNIH